MDRSLAPGFIRITYTGQHSPHHAIFPVNIDPDSVAGVEPQVALKDTTSVDVEDAVATMMTAWLPLLSSNQLVGLCEVYTVDVTTGEGRFIWGFDIDEVGGAGGDGVSLLMATFSFKLVNGRTYKTVVMENGFSVNTKVFAPYTPEGVLDDYAVWACGASSLIYGRGNAYPFAPISATMKTSDALRKKAGLS